jgi:hypothetical protein
MRREIWLAKQAMVGAVKVVDNLYSADTEAMAEMTQEDSAELVQGLAEDLTEWQMENAIVTLKAARQKRIDIHRKALK